MDTRSLSGKDDATITKKGTKKPAIQEVLNSKKLGAIFVAAVIFQLTDMWLYVGDQGSPEHLGIYVVVCIALYLASDWSHKRHSGTGSALKAVPVHGGKKHNLDTNQTRGPSKQAGTKAQSTNDTKAGSSHYNSLIEKCAKAADPEGAVKWLETMKRLGHNPTAVSYSYVIYGHAKAGNVDGAEQWAANLEDAGIEPNVISYCNVLHACAKVGQIDRAAGWLEKMQAKGTEPNDRCYNSVIDACAKAGNYEAAQEWVDKMMAAGFQADTISYNGVIDACAKSGNMVAAEETLEKMKSLGL